MPPEIRPRAVFERLFGSAEGERDPKRRARQELYQKSVLDVVLEDARRLQGALGGAEIGITEAHHGLTHHSGDKEKIEKVTKINCYHIQQLTYLLDKLKAVKEGDGTLLDHCMIAYGSGLADGNRHEHHNLPLILAGRGNGTLKPGRMVRYADETPITNLYVAMLDRMGVPAETLGDSTGTLGYLSDL